MFHLPASIGIIFNEDRSSVLLVKRQDIPLWVLPGGGIEKDETAEEALIREVLEETGLKVAIVRQSGKYFPINRLTALTSVFICQIEGGQMTLSSETSDIAFYPLQALPPLFFFLHKEWLDHALQHSSLVEQPLSHITYRKAIGYLVRHPFYTLRYLMTCWIKRH